MQVIEKLNIKATYVFCALIERLRQSGAAYIRLKKASYLPLSIELLYGGITTPWGEGKLYSLMHSFVQHGDLMRDPDMTFIVVDNRDQRHQLLEFVGIYPQSYQLDSLDIFQESIFIEGMKLTKFHVAQNREHCAFANIWLTNIEQQGFLS